MEGYLQFLVKEHQNTLRRINEQIDKLEINHSYKNIPYYDYDLFRQYLKRKFPDTPITMYDNENGTADINVG